MCILLADVPARRSVDFEGFHSASVWSGSNDRCIVCGSPSISCWPISTRRRGRRIRCQSNATSLHGGRPYPSSEAGQARPAREPMGGIENDSGARIDRPIDYGHRQHEPVERIFNNFDRGALSRPKFQHSVPDGTQQHHPVHNWSSVQSNANVFGSIPGRLTGTKKGGKIKFQVRMRVLKKNAEEIGKEKECVTEENEQRSARNEREC